jgi:cytochrome c556
MPNRPSALFAVALLFAVPALSADAPKSETVIAYRQSVFHMILWNYQPIAEMVRGRRPFDTADFRRRAARLAFLSQQLPEGFTPGSDKGATTDALPAIWETKSDFDAKLADFVREAKALRETAKTGDEAKMKDQFGKTSATCKSCHEKYRAE